MSITIGNPAESSPVLPAQSVDSVVLHEWPPVAALGNPWQEQLAVALLRVIRSWLAGVHPAYRRSAR